MPTVEVHPAWVFTCDECGQDSFCRSVVIEIDDPFERWQAGVQMGVIEAWQEVEDIPEGIFQSYPNIVTCGHCGAQFETVGH